MIRTAAALAFAASLAVAALPARAETPASWLPTLTTATPEEGFALAVAMARRAVKTTQPDVDALHKMRPNYAHDPQSLIDVSGVVAAYFATIAAANDYWRE
jgi:hypothetical protein